jgi:hypothetical protein
MRILPHSSNHPKKCRIENESGTSTSVTPSFWKAIVDLFMLESLGTTNKAKITVKTARVAQP